MTNCELGLGLGQVAGAKRLVRDALVRERQLGPEQVAQALAPLAVDQGFTEPFEPPVSNRGAEGGQLRQRFDARGREPQELVGGEGHAGDLERRRLFTPAGHGRGPGGNGPPSAVTTK